MSNVDTFRDWMRLIVADKPINAQVITAGDKEELKELFTLANKAVVYLDSIGKRAVIRGKGNLYENGFKLHTAGSYVHFLLKKKPKAIPLKKGVAGTSRTAYAELDKEAQATKVAAAVIELHKEFEWVSDTQVSKAIGIPANTISARRNEIEKMGGIMVGNKTYQFSFCPQKIKCPITGKTVQGWQLKSAIQAGVQTSMF